MRNKFILFSLLILSGLFIFKSIERKPALPRPTEGEENEKLREKYDSLRHKAAPGVNWRDIEARNAEQAQQLRSRIGPTASFANGAVTGTWEEKGASNQTGSVRALDYVPATNMLYNVSNGGTLWGTTLGSGAWTIQNQNIRFDGRTMKAFTKVLGGTRLLLSYNNNVYYSDDNGVTTTASSGITFPVGWGGNYISKLIRLNDAANTIYCLTFLWSQSPWGPRFWLYRSTDEGKTFAKIFEFSSSNDNTVSLCNPYNTNALYATDVSTTAGSVITYSITGTTVSQIASYAIGGSNTDGVLKGTTIAGTTTLYEMVNNNTIYISTNLGTTWTLKSTLPESAWDRMNVSPSNAALVCFGGVNAYRSANSGSTWTKINDWSEYYGNITAKLHADIMEIEYFKKTDNTEFAVIDCHGGTYLSYDNMNTVANQSVSSHKAQEYYDVITDTIHPNRIFCGAQDQGLQGTLTGTSAGAQSFSQIISGDYGHLCLTYQNQFLWPEYPGGNFYVHNNLGGTATYVNAWQFGGSNLSNYGWMLPAKATADINANAIWVGGGDMTGGSGSYLGKFVMLTVPGYTFNATQFSYNFRPNSNSGTAGVTALEQSSVNRNKLFVGMDDGTFFYSNDQGVTWNKSASFSGPTPWYLYGSCILSSHINQNVVWYAGSGYSNSPVYKSIDGGATFTSMSNGLPSTLVSEIVATPDERFIFAATDAGPYVYVTGYNTWYPLADNTTPVQFYSNVEYISSLNIVRFGTMGRGIWDFHLGCTGTAITWLGTVSSAWETPANWSCGIIPGPTSDVVLNAGANVVVSSNVSIATFTLNPTAQFRVNTPYVFTLLGH